MLHGRPGEAARVISEIEARIIASEHVTLPPVTATLALGETHRTTLVSVAGTLLRQYPGRTTLGLVLMAAQAFIYNAIFFTYALVLTRFYGVEADKVGLYILPFAVGNFLGPLLLGPLFDSIGRKAMIVATYGLSGLLLAVTALLFFMGLLDATTQTAMWSVVFFFASAAASAAYLTVGECFPLEIRALTIALFYAFGTLLGGVGGPWLFGVLIAGAISAFVPTNELKPYFGNEILSILMMIALGIPLYVCATASVPIAAGLIHMGASPGAALAFLIAGPATNAATISTVWKLLGKRTALLYLLTIALSAVVCGLMLDGLMSVVSIHMPELTPHTHHHMEQIDWISNFWPIALLLVIGLSYFWPTGESADSHEHEHEHEHENDHEHKNGEKSSMSNSSGTSAQRLELTIIGMTCSHCTAAVARAMKECEGVQSVEVNLKEGRAVIVGENLDSQKLLDAVKSLGYEAKT
jgi:copper chaperone CopZ/MFS family permease